VPKSGFLEATTPFWGGRLVVQGHAFDAAEDSWQMGCVGFCPLRHLKCVGSRRVLLTVGGGADEPMPRKKGLTYNDRHVKFFIGVDVKREG
jgi:hypothetical protein